MEHRLELAGEKYQVQFYNDSFSTTPETTIAAIESFKNKKVLILGGSSKKSDFSILAEKIVSDPLIKAILLIGQEAQRIKNSITRHGDFAGKIIDGGENMKEIVKRAFSVAESGVMVLLSPACASFGMFKNYKDRGEKFKTEVQKLKNK